MEISRREKWGWKKARGGGGILIRSKKGRSHLFYYRYTSHHNSFSPNKKGKIEIHSYSTRGKPHGDRYPPPPSSFAAGGERSAAAVEEDALLNISLGEFKLGWPGEKRHKPHFEGATHARNRLRCSTKTQTHFKALYFE